MYIAWTYSAPILNIKIVKQKEVSFIILNKIRIIKVYFERSK